MNKKDRKKFNDLSRRMRALEAACKEHDPKHKLIADTNVSKIWLVDKPTRKAVEVQSKHSLVTTVFDTKAEAEQWITDNYVGESAGHHFCKGDTSWHVDKQSSKITEMIVCGATNLESTPKYSVSFPTKKAAEVWLFNNHVGESAGHHFYKGDTCWYVELATTSIREQHIFKPEGLKASSKQSMSFPTKEAAEEWHRKHYLGKSANHHFFKGNKGWYVNLKTLAVECLIVTAATSLVATPEFSMCFPTKEGAEEWGQKNYVGKSNGHNFFIGDVGWHYHTTTLNISNIVVCYGTVLGKCIHYSSSYRSEYAVLIAKAQLIQSQREKGLELVNGAWVDITYRTAGGNTHDLEGVEFGKLCWRVRGAKVFTYTMAEVETITADPAFSRVFACEKSARTYGEATMRLRVGHPVKLSSTNGTRDLVVAAVTLTGFTVITDLKGAHTFKFKDLGSKYKLEF